MAKIVVNSELCKECKLCINVCPFDLIVLGEVFNSRGYRYVKQVNEEKCIACKLCAIMCPDSAISVYK